MGWNSFVKPGRRAGVTLSGGGRGATALPGGGHAGRVTLPGGVILAVFVALAWCPLFADGVTRTVEPINGGCKVTLAWAFSGTVESDLIIEERLARGWSVDDATVPFGSLDASWFSGSVARFAVKPALLAQPGSISFTVVSGEGAMSGAVSGDWKMYLGGALRKGWVAGKNELAAFAGTTGTTGTTGTAGTTRTAGVAAVPIAITSFKIVGGGIELAYSGVAAAGTLVVEGCVGLGKPWAEVKRLAVSAGDGKATLSLGEVGASRFFRLKFMAEE